MVVCIVDRNYRSSWELFQLNLFKKIILGFSIGASFSLGAAALMKPDWPYHIVLSLIFFSFGFLLTMILKKYNV